MTTKRVRNHELEDFSLAALRFELPPKWLIHEYKKDYGIDVQLEIFEVDGLATGLRCYCQLKATDNLADNDVISLDRNHFEYWSNHTDPVLLMRYYSNTKSFFWCWLHDVAWSLKSNTNSLNVARFLKPWDAHGTAKNIHEFLTARRRVFTERQLPPFLIAVRSSTASIETLVQVTSTLNGFEKLRTFRFEAESSNPTQFEVSLVHGRIACSYLGLPGVTVDEIDETKPSLICDLILLIVFLTAARYDRILVTRPLAKRYLCRMLNAAGDSYFAPLIDSIIYTVGLKDATNLVGRERIRSTSELRNSLFSIIAYCAAQRYGEADEWISMAREELLLCTVDGSRAALAYSLGNALSHTNDWPEALSMFKQAAEALPDYLNRGYFRHEYAAALFENGLFTEAALQYKFAIAIEDSPRLHYLLGDSLFSAGKFSEALVELNSVCEAEWKSEYSMAAYLLKDLCCEFVDGWKINHLSPNSPGDGGIDLLQKIPQADLKDLPKSYLPLMQEYGSDALFNFNAGHLALINKNFTLAAYRFLNCAVRQRGDSESWALAVGCAMLANDAVLLSLSIASGYFFVKERLLADFFKVTQFKNLGTVQREHVQRIFSEAVHSSARGISPNPLTVRIF